MVVIRLLCMATSAAIVLTLGYCTYCIVRPAPQVVERDEPAATVPDQVRIAQAAPQPSIAPRPPAHSQAPVTESSRSRPTRSAATRTPKSNRASRAAAAPSRTASAPPDLPVPSAAAPQVVIRDPLSREALPMVGRNGVATAYWATAINNKDIPPEERADLIEGLNEEGFADPENPTIEDLPLIVSRIEIILELAPESMDQTNADAFAEALKDLIEMYIEVTTSTDGDIPATPPIVPPNNSPTNSR